MLRRQARHLQQLARRVCIQLRTVATVGFPDIGLQGFAPKLAKGEIASLSGAGDDPRYFQIRGGTGHWPVPSGDPPDGMTASSPLTVQSIPLWPLPISFGGSPNETGGSPVPPIAGECELRGQEQPAVELPGIRAGGFSQAQSAGHG